MPVQAQLSSQRMFGFAVCLTAISLAANVGSVIAEESAGRVPLPGPQDRNTIGNYDSDSPYTPVIDFRNLDAPAAADDGDYCDPLIYSPNMFGTLTRAPQVNFLSSTAVPILRFQTYRLFADSDIGQDNAYYVYTGTNGPNTLNLDPVFSAPPIHLGSATGPLIAAPPGDTLMTTSAIVPFQPVGFQQQLQENSAVTAAAQTLALPGEITIFNPVTSVATLQQGGANPDYFIDYSYIYALLGITNFQMALPNPVDGAVVGRTLVSSNASPLPRDRILYDYDYLSSAQLTATGINLQRHVFGFEKTFFGGYSSITLRMPFASTLDTNLVSGTTQSTSTAFGNVQLDLKTILFMQQAWLVSGGMGISLPTASDVRMMDATQTTTLARINNETVVLKPFIAGLWTPTPRVFTQSWMYANFDTRGNPVQVDVLGNLTTVGRLNDAAALGFDTQLGYWLISPCESTGWLRGLAPFGELHYLTSMQRTDSVQYGGISIYDAAGRTDEFYTTIGTVAQIKTNWNTTLGITLPMLPRDNRFSDWNIGFRVNYFFGGTAANRLAGFNPLTY